MRERWSFLGVGLIVLLALFGYYQRGLAEERYTVKPGDTLHKISKSFGVPINVLKGANRLEKDSIKPKQVLLIPAQVAKRPSQSYVVKAGDSLYSIAKRTSLSVEEIKKMNQLQSTTLKTGQILTLEKPGIKREEEAEELSDGGEVTEPQVAGEEREKAEISEPLGKWSSSEERNLFVRVAKNFLGVPYRLGGSTIRGIDCSALVKKIYEIFNVTLPRTAREQFRIGKSVGREELEEGDLVFFKNQRSSVSHVGIDIGKGEFVHASSRDREVKVDHLDTPYFNKRFLRGVRVKELGEI